MPRRWDNYIAYLGDDIAPLYEVEILKCLGAKRCDEIDESAMDELIKAKLPKGDATPATLNRHLYRPVMARQRIAPKKKAPMLQRPKGHNTVKPVEVAKAEWVPGHVAGAQSQTAGAGHVPGMARPAHWRLGRRPKDLNGNVLILGKT